MLAFFAVIRFHTITVLSLETESAIFPEGCIAMEFTLPLWKCNHLCQHAPEFAVWQTTYLWPFNVFKYSQSFVRHKHIILSSLPVSMYFPWNWMSVISPVCCPPKDPYSFRFLTSYSRMISSVLPEAKKWPPIATVRMHPICAGTINTGSMRILYCMNIMVNHLY